MAIRAINKGEIMTLTPATEIKVCNVLSDGKRALRVLDVPGGVSILWGDPGNGWFSVSSFDEDDLLEVVSKS